MKKYAYKMINPNGDLIKGNVLANTLEEAQRVLSGNLSDGAMLVKVSQVISLETLLINQIKITLKSNELYLFSSQLLTLIRSGLKIVESLEIMEQMVRGRNLKTLCARLIAKLKSGETFSKACSAYPQVFNTEYISLIRAGENSGALTKTFQEIVDLLQWGDELKKKITKATRYPIVVITIAVIGALGTFQYLVPMFAGFFAGSGTELPFVTKILLNTSKYTRQFFPLIVGAIISIIVSAIAFRSTPYGKFFIDKHIFKTPLIGRLQKRMILARFLRIFAILYDQGVPIIGAFRVGKYLFKNKFYQQEIQNFEDAVLRGDTIASVADSSSLFSGLASQLLSTGEQGGSLADLSRKGSEIYDGLIEGDIDNLFAIFEPLTIIILGGFVLILVSGIFLPMIKMLAVVGR